MSTRVNRLNSFLLILIFLGITFILIKEKEAFGNAVHLSLDEAYKTPLLNHFSSNPDKNAKIGTNFTREGEIDNLSSYKQKTNNKYPSIPCDGKAYDGGICKALYMETEKVKVKTENCLPGFGCRRVGFFCSKLGK